MIIVDIEASGTDPRKHSIVSIGALEFENPSNQFYEECRIWDSAHVMEEALLVNGYSREAITDPAKKTDRQIVEDFLAWAGKCKESTLAGHNPSFDRDFIKYTAERYHLNWPLAHRTIDLHSICYFHQMRRGIIPPVKNNRSDLNSDSVSRYVGLPPEPKPHIAIAGARIEAEALSRFAYEKHLFPEFKDFPIPWLL